AAIEGDQRTEVRREHGDDREHHPLGAVSALAERLAPLQALDDLLALRLARRRAHLATERLAELVDVDVLEHLEDSLAAHARLELVVAVLLDDLGVALLGDELSSGERRLLRVDDDVRLTVEDLLEVLEGDVQDGPDA